MCDLENCEEKCNFGKCKKLAKYDLMLSDGRLGIFCKKHYAVKLQKDYGN